MFSKTFKVTMFVLIAVALLTAGCTTTTAVPQPTAAPTQPVVDLAATADALRTEVASTIAADLTSTAAAMPTETTAPTETAVPDTATPAPSLTPVLATVTAIPTIRIITVYPTFTPTPGPFQCQVTGMAQPYGVKMTPGTEFDGRWTIKNTGTSDWNAGTTDFAYVSGQKLQKRGDSFDIDAGLDVGKSMDLIVDMVAPRDLGFYHSEWAVKRSGTTLCILPVDIWVVNP